LLLSHYSGPQTFQASQAPAYTGGVVAMLVCYCVAILVSLVHCPTSVDADLVQLILMYYLNVVRLNRSKEAWRTAHAAELAEQDLLDEWHDETDFDSRRFVYVL
jgi:ACS family allantoate permease-like MFS transporter